jgi:hypothetical protein
MIRGRSGIALLTGVVLLSGCGSEDFDNDPRPAAAEELTAVIQEDKITVSPDGTKGTLGAGPFLITISNQTGEEYTVILDGEPLETVVQTRAINALDTGTIQQTLAEGSYEVRTGSEKAQEREIQPAELTIGPPRKSSNDDLLLP